MQLIGPVAEQEEHALAPQAPRQEGCERPRGAIRPMQVLDHEHHRAILPEQFEQLEQRLEEAQLR